VIIALFLILTSIMLGQAHAMSSSTSSGSVQVLEPIWKEDNEAMFKITFHEPDSGSVQRHVDFDLVVIDRKGVQIFSAAESDRQYMLHTNPGFAAIPYKFPEVGSYIVKVYVFGVNFIPTSTEFVEFPFNVTPEFPREITAFLAMATLVGITVTWNRLFRIQKKVWEWGF
jgi:hypothetical protein